MDTERNPFKNITAESQRTQRIKFLFVGRRRQTKTLLKLELKVLPNRRLPIGRKEFPQRTLRLCGEVSEFLSRRIGENLRLITLCVFGANTFIDGALLNILSVRI